MNHCLFWPTWCRLENVKWSNSRQFNPNFKIKTQKTHKQQSMRPLTCYKYFCQIYLFFGYLSIMANLVRPVWGVRLHLWTKWIWFLESASKKYAINMCWWFFENLSPPNDSELFYFPVTVHHSLASQPFYFLASILTVSWPHPHLMPRLTLPRHILLIFIFS